MMPISLERDVLAFEDEDAARLSNGDVELIASTSYGPRILSYRFRDGTNVFGFLDRTRQSKPTAFGEPWRIYGGHRLWHAPEHPVESYIPDNAPLDVAFDGTTLRLIAGLERATGLVKEISITLASRGSRVQVLHRISNAGDRCRRLAPWAITMMATGGEAIFPLPHFVPFPDALAPAGRLVLWPYTCLGDARFSFGDRYMRLRQREDADGAQKVGLLDEEHGWAAYAVGDLLFVKHYLPASRGTALTDLGCNVESFSNRAILELETLGVEIDLAPGETTCHLETWELFHGISVSKDDTMAERVLTPLVKSA